MRDLRAELRDIEDTGLYRRLRCTASPQGRQMEIDGRQLLSFCSNDYLGLANHPQVRDTMAKAACRWGAGSGAAHLINGHSKEHQALEEEVAEFVGRDRALLFTTGYMANLGVIAALARRGDLVLEDRLNHASLIDAGRLSGARFMRYRHGDVSDLTKRLQQRAHCGGEVVVATDGVFSMDGDLAPLADVARVCAEYGAWLVVDDAHGFGVVGRSGRGTADHFQLQSKQVPALVGTLGKAFGTAGAFVAGDDGLIEYLIQKARTYIYTTAGPPALAAATRVSLRLARDEQWRRDKLQRHLARFRLGASALGYKLMPSETPIQPIVVGDSNTAVAMSEALLGRGILVTPIRPPTVPRGTSRLRVTLSAVHEDDDVDRLLDALASIRDRLPAEV